MTLTIIVGVLAVLTAVFSGVTLYTLRQIEQIQKEPNKEALSDGEIDQIRQVIAIMSYMGEANGNQNKS